MVITPWGSDIQYRPKSGNFRFIKIVFNRVLINRLARKTKAVCCDSEAQKIILQRAGANPEKIKTGYNKCIEAKEDQNEKNSNITVCNVCRPCKSGK